MKSIIEREATFENNSHMEVKVTQKQLVTSICKGNTMKQDMLNSQIYLTSQPGSALLNFSDWVTEQPLVATPDSGNLPPRHRWHALPINPQIELNWMTFILDNKVHRNNI